MAVKTDTAEGTVSTAEVAQLLGVSSRTIRHFADRGVLPHTRLTPTSPRRFRLEDVALFARLARRTAA